MHDDLLERMADIPWKEWKPDPEIETWARWFIECIGIDVWRGRKKAIDDFLSSRSLYNSPTDLYSSPFVPKDSAAWHLYLCEKYVRDPLNYDLAQGSRIIPVVKSIMRDWPQTLTIGGVDDKVKEAFLHDPTQFDGALFEVLVAAAYARSGWKNVQFISKSRDQKQPDFQAEGRPGIIYVECKKKSRVSEYAKRERDAWLRMFNPIGEILTRRRFLWVLDVVLHVPIIELSERFLLDKIGGKLPLAQPGVLLDDRELTVVIRTVEIVKVQRELENHGIRADGSRLPFLLFGYDQWWRGVTDLLEFQPMRGRPRVIDKLQWAAGAIWSCDAPTSVSAKARYMKNELAEAVEQLPVSKPGALHWGIELYDGEMVGEEIYRKTLDTVKTFDMREKDVPWIYAHIFEFWVPPEGEWDVQEKCHWYAKDERAGADALNPRCLVVPQNPC